MSKPVVRVEEWIGHGHTTREAAERIQERIQKMLDDGWTLRAAPPRSVVAEGAPGLLLIFVRKE